MMKVANMRLNKGATTNNPKKIIVHSMGEFIDTDGQDYSAYSLLEKMGLSAHRLITPTGVVIKCRDDNEGAYHAKGYNTDSLGVEFLVSGLHTYESFLEAIKKPYLSDEQITKGLELLRYWMTKYSIEKDMILMHSEISPGRKHDPGRGFIEQQIIQQL